MTTSTTEIDAVKLLKKFHKIDPATTYEPGDVFQVNEWHDQDGSRHGWLGMFVVATEIKPWGFTGYAHQLHDHITRSKVWVRMEWASVNFVGVGYFDETINYDIPI